MCKNQPDEAADSNTGKIDNIFSKPHAFFWNLTNCMGESIGRIGDKIHIYHHGSTNACENNSHKEEKQIWPELGIIHGKNIAEEIQKETEYQTEWNLE